MSARDTIPDARPATKASSRPLWIVSLLGLNCWATTVAIPSYHLAQTGSLSAMVALVAWASIIALVVGVVLLWRRHAAGPWVLLIGVPLLAIAPAIVQPTIARGSVMSPLAVAIAGVSFAAYVLGACWASGLARVVEIDATTVPLDDQPTRRPKVLATSLLLFAGLGAAVIIASAHLLPFGPDASQVRVLSAGGLALWVAAFFGIVAPALRHRRPWPMAGPSRGAAVVWLLVVVVGLIMLAFAMSD